MFQYRVLVFSTLIYVSWCSEDCKFPPGFKFGAASSSYQIEGAWNVSDKGESIWDRFTHTRPEMIVGQANGDVACDSYHLWQTDIEKAVELGLHFYRFSISWPRILPTGYTNKISEDGMKYYDNLINGLLENGIEPLATLYHWELPQVMQDLGGWTNPLIADWFADYARVVFSLYGDRVKTWLTINEPVIICDHAYNAGVLAPGLISPDHGAYLCNKFVLMAHAKAYRVYDEEFRAKYHGEVSLANQLIWYDPLTEEDEDIAELARENCAGRYSHPIFSKEGASLFRKNWVWPPAIERIMEENSITKGYSKSTFPAFTEEEIKLVKGTFDFYAINYYTSRLVRRAVENDVLTVWPAGDIPDLNAVTVVHPGWGGSVASFVKAGRYSHPIFSKEGASLFRKNWVWPPAIERIMEENSITKGYSKSTFPAFTEEEIKLVKGTFDFYAINYYTSRLVRRAVENDVLTVWPAGDIPDLNAVTVVHPGWGGSVASFVKVFPEGIRRQLVWLKEHYGDMKFMITENGYPTGGGLDDQDRIDYFQRHLQQVLLAIKEDGVNLTHYTAWTLLDNFEWADGYSLKFGLYEVNFTDPQRTRTPRDSARYYASVIKNHVLNF